MNLHLGSVAGDCHSNPLSGKAICHVLLLAQGGSLYILITLYSQVSHPVRTPVTETFSFWSVCQQLVPVWIWIEAFISKSQPPRPCFHGEPLEQRGGWHVVWALLNLVEGLKSFQIERVEIQLPSDRSSREILGWCLLLTFLKLHHECCFL